LKDNTISIPEARDQIREIAQKFDIPELNDIADQMYRRGGIRRARVKSILMTPDVAERIRLFAADHPEMHLQEIANHFEVNIGRVSEALNRKI